MTPEFRAGLYAIPQEELVLSKGEKNEEGLLHFDTHTSISAVINICLSLFRSFQIFSSSAQDPFGAHAFVCSFAT
jgi:hypothetical protein